ncbi:MAG: lysylphosphatidylglycerol synthase transmembrane domain-containing protein [Chloroflexota bacterium]
MAHQQPSPQSYPTLTIDRRWLVGLLAFGLISVVALLFLGGGMAPVVAIRQAEWPFLLVALGIHYSGFGVRGLRWQTLLGGMGHRLPYGYCTSLLIVGWFVSAVIPARAGDLLRIGLLHRPLRQDPTIPSIPMSSGVSSIVLERLLDMAAILLLGASFGLVVVQAQLPEWILLLYGTGLGLMVVVGLALFTLPHLWEGVRHILHKIPWQHSLWQKIGTFGAESIQQVRQLFRKPRVGLWVLLLSLYIWLCDALLLWLVMASLGEWNPFGSAAFIALTVDGLAAIPLTPGGVGQIEAAYAGLLAFFELPVIKLSAIILLTRTISYWSFLLFSGLVAFAFGAGTLLKQPPKPT